MNLNQTVGKLPSIGPFYKNKLEKLGIFTIKDLLYHIPTRYNDFRIISDISSLQLGETVTVQGKLTTLKNLYTKSGRKLQFAEIEDRTGCLKVIWFNQPFLTRTLKKGESYSFSGKVELFSDQKSLISPVYEKSQTGQFLHTGRLVPIYPETKGVSSKWLRAKIFSTLSLINKDLPDYLDIQFLDKENFPSLEWAIRSIHFPQNPEDSINAKRRLAFDEILFLELTSLARKKHWQKSQAAYNLKLKTNITNDFISKLPFELTKSQEKAIKEVYKDLSAKTPMNRLLEGDVGSGKTVIAAYSCFAAFVNGFQSVVMAPTQILANQHYTTFSKIFKNFKIRTKLITSAGIEGDLGNTDIFIGTHALIHKVLDIKKVALVVIDEQHRFGVEQRAHLIKKTQGKNKAPHVLTMTATPIPRTVALTVYGDLELSTLDELPKNRKPITSWIVPPQKRNEAYKWIGDKIRSEKIQVYIVCPLIDESQTETMKDVRSVTVEFNKLKDIFKEFKLGLLHGKLKAIDKNLALQNFKRGKFDILVATPVVEVGIDVPNATIMLIEGSERFGLSQLHQLRGRVGRSDKKSYCLFVSETKSGKVFQRLNALTKKLNGFELAELDLKLRGPGDIYGLRQHGFPNLKIADFTDLKLIKSARDLAIQTLNEPSKHKSVLNLISSDGIVAN